MNELSKLLKLSNYKELTTAEIIAKTPGQPFNFDIIIPDYYIKFKKNLLNTSSNMTTAVGTFKEKLNILQKIYPA